MRKNKNIENHLLDKSLKERLLNYIGWGMFALWIIWAVYGYYSINY